MLGNPAGLRQLADDAWCLKFTGDNSDHRARHAYSSNRVRLCGATLAAGAFASIVALSTRFGRQPRADHCNVPAIFDAATACLCAGQGRQSTVRAGRPAPKSQRTMWRNLCASLRYARRSQASGRYAGAGGTQGRYCSCSGRRRAPATDLCRAAAHHRRHHRHPRQREAGCGEDRRPQGRGRGGAAAQRAHREACAVLLRSRHRPRAAWPQQGSP